MPTTNLDAMRQKIRQYARENNEVQTLPEDATKADEPSDPIQPPALQSYHLPLAKEKVDHFQENQLNIPIGKPSLVDPIPLNQYRAQPMEISAMPPAQPEIAQPLAVNPEPLNNTPAMAQPQPARPAPEQMAMRPQLDPEVFQPVAPAPAVPEEVVAPASPEQRGLLFNPSENAPAKPAAIVDQPVAATPENDLAIRDQEQPSQSIAQGQPIQEPPDTSPSETEPAGSSGPHDASLGNLIQFRRQKTRQNLTHAA